MTINEDQQSSAARVKIENPILKPSSLSIDHDNNHDNHDR
jgi:hypothetical protein